MRILVFAGTTEGRQVAEYLNGTDAQVYVSAATEYGGKLLARYERLRLLWGRMDEEEITVFLREKRIHLVIDATHPFAVLATAQIRRACHRQGVRYLRCLREACEQETAEIPDQEGRADVRTFGTLQQAVTYLKSVHGNIFISTGSKELEYYTQIPHYKERCYVRVLSVWDSVKKAIELGFEGSHLMAMQGPFSEELNTAVLRQTGAGYFVTKASGKAGGFQEKYRAAEAVGAVLVVIGRPDEEGFGVEEICQMLDQELQDGSF